MEKSNSKPTGEPAGEPAGEPTKQQLKTAEDKIKQALVQQGPDAAFQELMKHPVTGQQMGYAESRMYFG